MIHLHQIIEYAPRIVVRFAQHLLAKWIPFFSQLSFLPSATY